ncbi:nuclear factor of activated T-cells, cytoplasmic 1 [Xenopus tropicalis]|uniref:Nuclear factor of activated T-cells, cytoplasmic 1 n=1 Tax=Xenopus tropicalis TaxID=8364 RepID=A0JM38_XENTR|nr:nuclear factor of activated T-cells, cytoplasmic 1 [Xenopus tropicalis]AAI25727.1 nuclear factor of activated T-cells, cytoplasmic, calcineurin-dependent 1 [Xenopus tropicalis]|eukprot:NP_001072740.1 nuclear factor of activated T-cells, cytoplasmic 1 [Xenopus tropicalis]
MSAPREEPELDFDYLFEYEYNKGEQLGGTDREHFNYASSNLSASLSPGVTNSSLSNPCHGLQSSNPVISIIPSSSHPPGYGGNLDSEATGYYLSPSIRPVGPPALESPRIEITSCLAMHPNHNQFFNEPDIEEAIPQAKRIHSTATLNLPNVDTYRDPSCLSPASSLSSRSCNSEASSFESNYSYPFTSPQTSPWQSPCVSPKTTDPEEGYQRSMVTCTLLSSPRHSPSTSPRTSISEENWLNAPSSRPSSPCIKRKYSLNGRQTSYSPHHSPTPSPHNSPRVSVTDETWLGNTHQYTSSAIVAAINALTTDPTDMNDGIPIKSRKTAADHTPNMSLKTEPVCDDHSTMSSTNDLSPDDYSGFHHIRKGNFCDQYLSVPQQSYQWAKPKNISPTSYLSPSLPALDWHLPSQSGPYELRIEVQPKSHHRAHYETEGSRGAVKASTGGHPIVQLHGYLENEPLTIQLFIGTADDRLLRPHAFYQVHRITGKTVSTTSHETIISNTKVLEIPLLPENNMRAIIDCAGILKLRNSDIELRKGETDIGRKNTRVRLVFRVHIPQANGRTLTLQVASNPIECSQRSAQELPLVEKQSTDNFPVIGGKKMILNGHNFHPDSKVIFVEKAPVPIIKTEPTDDYESAQTCVPMSQGLTQLSKPYYSQQIMMPPDPGSCLVSGFTSCQQRNTVMSSSPISSPKLHDLSASAYNKCISNPGHTQLGLQQTTGGVPTIQEVPRSIVGHPSSPDQSSPIMLQPQVSLHQSSSCPLGFQQTVYPNSPSSPVPSITQEPSYLQPCSPTHSAVIGQPQHQHQKVQRNESPNSQPLSLPELHEDSNHNLAPIPVTIKREPEELDQLYLDDVNEIIRNDLSSNNNVHS